MTATQIKHTPGPWRQHKSQGKLYASVRGPCNELVADCGSRSDLLAQANARLIAAAPELLETLISLRFTVKTAVESGLVKFDVNDNPLTQLEAAIATAKGEQ